MHTSINQKMQLALNSIISKQKLIVQTYQSVAPFAVGIIDSVDCAHAF